MTQTTSNANARDRVECAVEWAVRLTDGAARLERCEEFDAWLAADPLNTQALEEVVATWQAVEYYATSAEIVALREAALAAGRRALTRRRGVSRWPRLGWIFAVALLLMLGGAGLWRWLMPQVYETRVGERRVFALPDGSKISFDAATVVKVAYSQGQRQLWLERGRAKFDVARDPLRPFSVVAADKVVVATGTSFSVERIENQVRVVLYEGHVALLEANGSGAPRPLVVGEPQVSTDRLLTVGREIILPAEPVSIRFEPALVAPADPARSLSWETGMLVFDDEPLNVAIDRMNRYATTPLVIGDEAVARLRISGVFRAGDTDALVEGLAAAFDVQARQEPGAISLFESKSHVSHSPAS